MDFLSESDTSFQLTECPKYFNEFVGLNRSGILRKGRWSLKSEVGTENDGDDEEEEEDEQNLPICKYFDRWVEGRKLKVNREPRVSEQFNQSEDDRGKWLHNWTIRVLSSKEGSVVLMGQRASSTNPRDVVGINYIAGRVLEALNSHEIKTTKGEFTLVGSITDERKRIPSSVVKHFNGGFPSNWSEIIRRHWASNSASASSSDESIVIDSTGKRKNPTSKQPSKALSLNKKKSKLGLPKDGSPIVLCKEISLSDWTLRRDPVEGFTISGIVESSSNKSNSGVIQAGRILSRVGPKKVKTELGVFKLNGGISDKDRCLPELIKSKFAASFPCQWKKLLNGCLNNFPTVNTNQDSSDERDSENSLDSSVADESTVFDAKQSQSTQNPSYRKRKFCEDLSPKKMEKRETVSMDNSLDESISSCSEGEKENKRQEPPIINPCKKRAKKDDVKNRKGRPTLEEKSNTQKKTVKSSNNKVKPIEKKKTIKTTKKRQSVVAIEKPVLKKSAKGKTKPTNAKRKNDKKNKKDKDADVECDFNISLGDAFSNKNGNASLFSSFISDGAFGSTSFKDFSLGKCLLSAKKSRSRQGAETPPLMSMDFNLLKNTTSNSIHSANSSICNQGNLKSKQEITKRVKKLNKASPKQSKKPKQNTGKFATKRNKDVDDLLKQMTSSRKGMSTPVLVRKVFRPRTPNSDNDSWDSDNY
ncbi:hypothetical protein LSTR_LSTR001261 [Laodelphax striatellus]|uniref:SANTA domain-containing protein n=1 Tax=Laodelphax striatellus TaxID=195883 RepID=A0A482XBM8_LAOST|nr:hypothetical protein LSTR_LSTR001261 [Laodelphax striatellus]